MSINEPFLSFIWLSNIPFWGFLGGTVVKNPLAIAGDARDVDLISGLERSPGEGNGNLFQYSCLGNLIDRGDYPWGSKELDMTEQPSTHTPPHTQMFHCICTTSFLFIPLLMDT